MDTELRIVGIDPGTTSGVAVLDLEGEIVNYASRKEFSKDRIIQFIVDSGKPLVVATDVSPAPSLVKEIASNTGSVLAVPDEDLDRRYKEELVEDFRVAVRDSHVADALAASEYARREHRPKIEEIESRVRKEGVEEHLGDVVELVVKGKMSISGAISEVDGVEEEEPEEEGGRPIERDWRRIAERRQERIDLLESKVSNLQEHLEGRGEEPDSPGIDEEELKRRNRLIKDLKADMDRKSAALERAEARIETLREGLDRLSEGWLRVPKVDELSSADNRAVFVEDYRGGGVSSDVETVLTEGRHEGLESEGLGVVDMNGVEGKLDLGDSYVVDPEELETAEDSERFMEWLEAYRQR